MSSQNPQPAELSTSSAQRKIGNFLTISRLIDRGATILVVGFKCVTVIYIAHEIATIILALAGKKTDAHISVLVSVFSKFDVADVSAWIVTAIVLLYAWNERNEKRRKTERLSSRIRELETRLDAGRTSSGLKSSGDTADGDKT